MRVLAEFSREHASSKSPIEGMMVESIEQTPPNEDAIVGKLITSFTAAKRRQATCPSPYLPGADWKTLLESQWQRYLDAIRRDDVGLVASLLRNFFRNEGLSGFWGGDRMFDVFAALDGPVSLRRADLMRRQFEVWRETAPTADVTELSAPQIGNPWGYIVDGVLLYEPVCEYHYQACYFAKLLSQIDRPVVLEIGGGFGGLAYQIVTRLPRAKYIGFDLPENIFLQGYYLSCAFPQSKMLIYREGLETITNDLLAQYDIVLLPNFMIPATESSAADLIVNARSLSEMPADTIAEYHQQIDRLSRLFFFHENIFKSRGDGLHGIPSPEFPALTNLVAIAESESRWPRYQSNSGYPCRENLFLHRSVLTPQVRPGPC